MAVCQSVQLVLFRFGTSDDVRVLPSAFGRPRQEGIPARAFSFDGRFAASRRLRRTHSHPEDVH